jgi:hypothetical protein
MCYQHQKYALASIHYFHYSNRTIVQGIITLDSLRIELHAGRISQEHEDEAIRQLEQDGLENLNFMDFLVRWI